MVTPTVVCAVVVVVSGLIAMVAHLAATIPGNRREAPGDRSDPRFQWWWARTWLPVLQCLVYGLMASVLSPTWGICLWSLAGPWAVVMMWGEGQVAAAALVTLLLAVGLGSYSICPRKSTALISCLCGFAWFVLGFGTVRVGV